MKMVRSLYSIIFKDELSLSVASFLKNLRIVSAGYLLLSITTFLFQIVIGRGLGPSGYGNYSLVNSIAMFLYLPMSLGITTALMKYNTAGLSVSDKKKNISTSVLLLLSFSLISVLTYAVIAKPLSNMLHVTTSLLMFSVIFAFLYSVDVLVKSGLRSIGKFKALSVIYALYGLSVLIVYLLTSYVFKVQDYRYAIYSIFLSYIIVIILGLKHLAKYIGLSFDKAVAKRLLVYGVSALLGGISTTILSQISKILINNYLSLSDVGVYNAYYTASINIILILNTMFITVFFPTVSAFKVRRPIFEKIKKVSPYIYLAIIPLMMLSQYLSLKLLGANYPIDFKLMLLFSISAALVLHNSIYAWTYTSEGLKGVRISITVTTFIAILNVLFSFVFIPKLGLSGAIIATAISYLIGITIFVKNKHKID